MNARRPRPNPLGDSERKPPTGLPLPPRAFPTSGVMRPATNVPFPAAHPAPAEEDVTPSRVFPPAPAWTPPVAEEIDETEADELYASEYGFDATDSDDEEDEVFEIDNIDDIDEDDEAFLRRIYLSGDEESAPQTLYALASDSDWQVRDSVARNENTPDTILQHLANDKNDMVRQSVLENETIPDELLATFVEDEEVDILIAFIEHPRVTSEMLVPLFEHPDDIVRDALRNSNKLSQVEKLRIAR